METSIITKEVLLKSDPALKNRPYQIEALLQIFRYEKCLVKMFCGTGKSRIITNTIIHEKKELSVVVFPSLALINQYSADYLNHEEYKKHFKKHKTMNVSSESLTSINSTTDSKEIKKFLKSKGSKIILVTYQSYQTLLDCLEGKKIGLVCYDEAHHVVSPECQKLVFGTAYYEKEVFFTATPKNENGITMFDCDDPEKNMCGPVAYNYTYLQGFKDEVLNAFEVCVDMFTENTNASIYEAIARAILTRGTNRVLSFHSGVNGEGNTNVKNFVNLAEFQTAFDKVLKTEFPEKSGYYKKFTFQGMDGKTPSAERKALLSALDDTPNNEIYIISSCETIGEGVDTKKANMCVFADPKSSITKIIQNIGRVVRRNPAHPLSNVLIPCFVNMENYAEAQGDKEKQDELIRQQMRATNGDYAPILNVLGALKQEDPELYEACLNYPNRRHKEESLAEQGFRIAEMDEEADDEDEFASEIEEYSAEEVQEMKETGEPLEIHTNDTIERFNEDSEDEPLRRLYHDEEEDVYKPIIKTRTSTSASEADSENASEADSDSDSDADSAEYEDDRRIIQPPKPKPRGVGLSIHQNDDIQMLWGVKGELDFSKKFCSVVIECEVVKIDQMELAIGIVERAKAREANGEKLLPRQHTKNIDRTSEQMQERKDACKLSSLKQILKGKCNGTKPRDDVLLYLDTNLLNWRYEIDRNAIAYKEAENIIFRANLRKNEGKNLLPRDVQKKRDRYDSRTFDEVQEQKDCWKLQRWRQNKSGKRGHICPDKVIKLLDETLPGWSEYRDLDEIAYKFAEDIIYRTKIRFSNGMNLFPKNYAKKKDNDDRTKDQIQENKDAAKLSGWKLYINNKKMNLDITRKCNRCPDKVIKLLDKELPGWSNTLNDESLNAAKEIVTYINDELNGEMPTIYHKPKGDDTRTELQKKEYKYALKLSCWKQGLKGIGNWKCPDHVRDYLDKEIPGWNYEQDFEQLALNHAKKIVEFVKNENKGELPIRRDKPIGNDTRPERERLENSYALKLGGWRHGKNCYDNVRIYLDLNLPGWSNTYDGMTIAKEIVAFVKIYGKPKNYNKPNPQQINECRFAQKLNMWKEATKGKGTSKCPDDVHKYLDSEIPGWCDDPITLDVRQMNYAIELVKYIKENLKGNLPKRYDKPKGNDTRTNEERVEHSYALKLGGWRKALNGKGGICTNEVRDLLDKELPGWRPIETPQVVAPPPKKRSIKKQTAISTSTTTEKSEAPHHFPPPSAIGLLHKTYLKMRSDTLNQKFKTDPQLWREYHTIRKQNFATYPPESIPAIRIIAELEKIQTKRQKVVMDMGCGEAPIAHHFRNKNDNRFTFHNYDHQSGGDPQIKEVDISALPLEDAEVEIAIMSLALWGTQENCTQYLKEAYRVLESGGKFYISDSTKKWSPEILTPENGGERLRTMLIDNGFKIINEEIGTPFCFFECVKK